MTTQANDPDAGNYNWRETDPGLWTCEPGSHCKLELFQHEHLRPAPRLRIYVSLPPIVRVRGASQPPWVLAWEETVPARELDPGDFLSPLASAEISFWDWLRTLGASTLP